MFHGPHMFCFNLMSEVINNSGEILLSQPSSSSEIFTVVHDIERKELLKINKNHITFNILSYNI